MYHSTLLTNSLHSAFYIRHSLFYCIMHKLGSQLTVCDALSNDTAVITTEQVACVMIHLSVLSDGKEILPIRIKGNKFTLDV